MVRRTVRAACRLGLLAVLGCSSDPQPRSDLDPDAGQLEETPDGDAGQDPHDGSAESPALRTLSWLLALLNGPPEEITALVVEPRIDSAVIADLPPETVAAVLGLIGAQLGPLEVADLTENNENALSATLTGRHGVLSRLGLSVRPGTENLTGLLFELAPELDPELGDWTALESRLLGVAPALSALVASVNGTDCLLEQAILPDLARPIGSLFKLYVLGAVVDRVEQAELAWTDTIAIRDEWKSIPSGELRNAPAGTLLPINDLADEMISVSDNTATDHLLHTLGRAVVEAQQLSMGHAAPQLNRLFLTTREMALLKLGATEEQQAYAQADEAERRRLLDELVTRALPDDLEQALGAWTLPRAVDQIEWFASATDLCRAFAWISAAGQTEAGAPALAALALNPGLPLGSEFSYAGFKGGSEPGVLGLGWLLERRADQARKVVVLLTSDPAASVAELPVLYFAEALVDMAAR